VKYELGIYIPEDDILHSDYGTAVKTSDLPLPLPPRTSNSSSEDL
jgi:hypothetical protein